MNDYTGGGDSSTRSRNRASHGVVTAALLAVMLTGIGCSSLSVYSNPPGARVFRNGKDTGLTTPTSIRVRHLPTGRTVITVAKEGYVSVPPKQEVDVEVSIGNIVWSWWPPVLIKNLCGDMWKGVTYPPSERLEEFNLRAAPGNLVAGEVAQEESPVPPQSEQPARKAMTNDDVVAMIKAGLPETTIIASIKRGPSAFDTAPRELIDMKNQGATAGVLEAMMGPQQQVPARRSQERAPQPAVAPPAQEPASHDGNNGVAPSASTAPGASNEYIVGKTTKADVIAKLGEPNGRGVKADGSETLTYASERWTGNAFNPFYFGSDNVRKQVAVFEFDQNGVLKEFLVSEAKSIL